MLLRRRAVLAANAGFIALVGIGIRENAVEVPYFVRLYAPDALWAMLVFTSVLFCKPNLAIKHSAAIALVFSFFIEFSQLIQTNWLNDLRSTLPGSLVLGHGFLWTDLLCYTAGVGFGALVACRFQPFGRKHPGA